ncbi:MAG: SCO family protein [Opitutae bacterium]|nr:SCO family protein [Opitutae bacterium]
MKPSYSPFPRLVAVSLMAALAAIAPGCGKQEAPVRSSAPAAPAEKRHPLTGEVVKADTERSALIVTHDEIKGFMPAMTMEFKVAKGDLAIARPGTHIRAELVRRGSDFHLEKIWPDDAATRRALDAAAKALAQDTAMRGKEAYREIGEVLPEFTLLDQEGRAVSGSRFRGRQIVLNFIFTRCPIATMCPAATERMARLQKAAREAGATDFDLVSISLDPEYDTPGVLKDYAQARGLDTTNWSFLTGPDAAVRHLLAQLGVIREFEGATIKHTLATVLINEDGKIAYRMDGSMWAVEDFVRRLKKG